MFVAAFPLGPLFALLNIIVEIRLDAINFLCHFRRPDAVRAEDIGAWYTVLEVITKVSVLVNAFVLAFTSEFIPKLVYKMVYSGRNGDPSNKGTLIGYVNNSLASIDLNTLYTWENGTQPINPTQNLNYTRNYCRYVGQERWSMQDQQILYRPPSVAGLNSEFISRFSRAARKEVLQFMRDDIRLKLTAEVSRNFSSSFFRAV